MRVAFYTQHFVGVGHHVRTMRLARAFSEAAGGNHQVVVFDGGRPLPGDADAGAHPGRVQLPPLLRGKAGIETGSAALPLASVLAARRRQIVAGLRRLQPDVLIIDSFPFSRWVLRDEILAAISEARASNPAARVLCSVRDVPRASQERFGEHARGWDSRRGRPWPIQADDDVLEALPDVINSHFDAVLVHGDARVSRLEDHFPWVDRLGVPVHYTGYVRQAPADGLPGPGTRGAGPLLVVSVGGGVNGLRLIEQATAALGELRRRPGRAHARMQVFAGAFMSATELAAAAAACRQQGVGFRHYSRDFTAWLRVADLSISRGGYNTVVAVLAAGVQALILPASNVSDQAFRVQRLAELGMLSTAPEPAPDASRMAELMHLALDRPRPALELDLAGAERTVQLVTALAPARPAPDAPALDLLAPVS